MSVDVVIRHRLGDFALDVRMQTEGLLTAIFGASGSGKTSIINVIAGLIRPDFGKVVIDGHTLFDSEAGIDVPVHRRHVGYVFQDARLFPHMTVKQNLSYGRWFTPQQLRYTGMEQIVSLLDIAHLLQRKPHQLSGGEKQRVALGRALLQSPRLLLMDEPLSSLDRQRKKEILPYIERLRDELKIPIIYVSHAIEEVARLATDIAIVKAGHVEMCGPAGEVVQSLGLVADDDPAESSALLEMPVEGYNEQAKLTTLRSPLGTAQVPGFVAPPGQIVRLHIFERDVIIATVAPRGLSALNIFAGVITAIEDHDMAAVKVRIARGDASIVSRITRQSCAMLGLKPGMEVFAIVKSVSIEARGVVRNQPRAG